MIPASRAVSIASPFGVRCSRNALTVSGDIRTRTDANARRAVCGLALVSTIATRPSSSMCVNRSIKLLRVSMRKAARRKQLRMRSFDHLPCFDLSFHDLEDGMRGRLRYIFKLAIAPRISRPQLLLQMPPLIQKLPARAWYNAAEKSGRDLLRVELITSIEGLALDDAQVIGDSAQRVG